MTLCLICRKLAERHHIKTRGAGGMDDDFNIMPLCRYCHLLVHSIGLTSFSKRYQIIENWLISNGWEFDEFLNKWKHYELTPKKT